MFFQDRRQKTAWPNTLPAAVTSRWSDVVVGALTSETDPGTLRESNTKPEESPSHSRDMFAGHGMFTHLWPIGYAMALFGLLPITFNPGESFSRNSEMCRDIR